MKVSAGLLMYRKTVEGVDVFLVHPGGPYFKNKDGGWWTIPKGEPEPGEHLKEAAIREFQEETGILPSEPYYDLGSIKQKGGKTTYAWAFEGNWDPLTGINCNTFEIEWPPKSGRKKQFPEIDKAEWTNIQTAREKMNLQQLAFLDRLKDFLISSDRN